MEQLISFYDKVLQSLDCQANEDGYISIRAGEELSPVFVSEKRLVLPTHAVLREGNWKGRMAFHPLSENAARGESAVLKKLRALINAKLSSSITLLLMELMSIAADTGSHQKLSPEELRMLQHVPDVDKKTVDNLVKMLHKVNPLGDNKLVNVYLKRGGVLRERTWSRTAMVTFPITEEFELEGTTIFGVDMRKKDKAAIIALYNWLIPNADDPTHYSVGSSCMVAPYFDALMNAYINVASRLNVVSKMFKKNLDEPKVVIIDLSWAAELSNLSQMKDMIPALDGNDGEMNNGQQEPANVVHAATVANNADVNNRPIGQLSAIPSITNVNTKIEPLGKPLDSVAHTGATLGRPLTENADDWQTFMARKTAIPGPVFQPVNNGRGGLYNPNQPPLQQQGWGYQQPQQQPTAWNNGYQAPVNPNPIFASVGGTNRASGQRDDKGWPVTGTVSAV